ncbi:MAG: hypothetical protein J07HQX50_01217 [Haloquadratum sp. J07HQX50]|nr:MAG: hypothetical protein J07HQX50_01217 [Haloquadratum sp. J07HQX50]
MTDEPLRQFAFEFTPAVTAIDRKRYAPEQLMIHLSHHLKIAYSML